MLNRIACLEPSPTPPRSARHTVRRDRRDRRALPLFLALAELVAWHLRAGAAALTDDAPAVYDADVLRRSLEWFAGLLGDGQQPDAELVRLLRQLADPPVCDTTGLRSDVAQRCHAQAQRYRHLAIAVELLWPAFDALAVHAAATGTITALVALESLKSMQSLLEGEIYNLDHSFAAIEKLVGRTLGNSRRLCRPR
jgi:hypothetical protein